MADIDGNNFEAFSLSLLTSIACSVPMVDTGGSDLNVFPFSAETPDAEG